MVNVGISRGAAAAICASAAIILRQRAWRCGLAAKAAEMLLIDFAQNHAADFIAAIIGMAIAHFSRNAIWIKENISHEMRWTWREIPPRPGVLCPFAVHAHYRRTDFDGKWGREVILLPSFLRSVCCWPPCWNSCAASTRKMFSASKWLIAAWRCVCRRCDAAGRGGRFRLWAEHHYFGPKSDPGLPLFWLRQHVLMLVLVILTMLAAMTTGSGNAPFTPLIG